jgi:succinate dehydrogenase / fumarate reductase cytochrome b subunit
MNALTRSLSFFWHSSIGRKILVALTGLVFIGFLAGHLTGNLLVFAGRDAFNDYALFLHTAAHGGLVWVARIGLLASLVIHVLATLSLVRENRAAREPYAHKAVIQASRSGRLMIWSGLTILAFIIYHLLHFTFRVSNNYGSYVDQEFLAKTQLVRPDAWRMVIEGFSWGPAVLFYAIALTLLCSHLHHGFGSAFQTLGFRSKKARAITDTGGKIFAFAIWAGFLSIPVAIYFFRFGR